MFYRQTQPNCFLLIHIYRYRYTYSDIYVNYVDTYLCTSLSYMKYLTN